MTGKRLVEVTEHPEVIEHLRWERQSSLRFLRKAKDAGDAEGVAKLKAWLKQLDAAIDALRVVEEVSE